jgi:hypothetical protein
MRMWMIFVEGGRIWMRNEVLMRMWMIFVGEIGMMGEKSNRHMIV